MLTVTRVFEWTALHSPPAQLSDGLKPTTTPSPCHVPDLLLCTGLLVPAVSNVLLLLLLYVPVVVLGRYGPRTWIIEMTECHPSVDARESRTAVNLSNNNCARAFETSRLPF